MGLTSDDVTDKTYCSKRYYDVDVIKYNIEL